MNIFLVGLLIGALLIIVYQRELLLKEQEDTLFYKDFYQKAEGSLSAVLSAWKLFINGKTYRKMERAYHASMKRAYKVAGSGRDKSVRESVAWGFTDLYDKRENLAAWKKADPATAPAKLGLKILRRRMGIARSLHAKVEKPACLA